MGRVVVDAGKEGSSWSVKSILLVSGGVYCAYSLFAAFLALSFISISRSNPFFGETSIATVASGVASLTLLFWIVGRRESRPCNFLGLKKTQISELALSCCSAVLFFLFVDSLFLSDADDGEELLSRDLFSSLAGVALLVSLGIVSPVFEEILFRGFLYRGLVAAGRSSLMSALLSVIIWLLLHESESIDSLMRRVILGASVTTIMMIRGSTASCCAFHIAWNSTALLYSLA